MVNALLSHGVLPNYFDAQPAMRLPAKVVLIKRQDGYCQLV
jgi:hypothetical protein